MFLSHPDWISESAAAVSRLSFKHSVDVPDKVFKLLPHRSGSVEGLWRSSRVLTWVTCSERRRPTRFPEERDRSSTRITAAWRRSGWMNSRTSFTSSLLVRQAFCAALCSLRYACRCSCVEVNLCGRCDQSINLV